MISMSKRFKVYSDSYSADIVDEKTGKNYNQMTDIDDICDLLNQIESEKSQVADDIMVLLMVVERATDFNITKMYASEIDACNRLKKFTEWE